jgi:hypothetical protein
MKKTNTLIMVLAAVLFASCEDHDTKPTPVTRQLRPERVTYGDFSYRVFSYNDRNQVATITAGFIAEGEAHETLHEIVYEGDRIDRIVAGDWELDYLYEGDKVSETHEYRQGELKQINVYLYDLGGRVKTLGIYHDNGEGEFVPLSKTRYAYNGEGNMVSMKQYYYSDSEQQYIHATTIEYEDFDDKKSSSALFLSNLQNVYDVKFRNNPRRWRLSNTNGSSSEENFIFEYNEQGYVTCQRPVSGGAAVSYYFSSY